MVGLDMKPRTWCRLRRGSMLPPSLAGAEVTMLAITGPPRMVSIFVASRPSTWRRSVSSSDRTRMNPSASSDSMTSVSMLRLVSTRSEIWNR